MARSSVGLVLRQRAVEVVEVRRTFGGTRLLKQARVPIEGSENAQVVSAIQTAFAMAEIRPHTRVALTMSPQEVLLRSFSLPLLPKAEWETAVRFEARKYIPFKIEEFVWSAHLTEQPDTKQLAVVFAGIRTETFAKIKDWLKGAGINANVIEAPWLSLARLGGESRQTPAQQFIGIVDLEPDTAHLVIGDGQVPYLGRDIALTVGEGPGEASPTEPSVDPRAQKLLNELRLSFDFFSRGNPSAVMDRVLFVGEAATLNAWCPWLASQLPCPVTAATLPLQPAAGGEVDLTFGLAVGVALRGLRAGGVKLDFTERKTPPQVASAPVSLASLADPRQLLKSVGKAARLQVTIALLVIGLLSAIGHQQVASARQQLAKAVQSFPDVGWGLKDKQQQELENLRDQVDKRLAFLHKILDHRVSMTKKLDALAKVLPDGVWLDSLRYRRELSGGEGSSEHHSMLLQGGCFLGGSGNELSVISNFAKRMREDKRFFEGFTTVQLGEIKRVEDQAKQYSYRVFQVTCQSGRKL